MSERYTLKDLLAIMARLRGADGCPWDREQTFESLKQYLIEECYEVIDAIDSGQPDRHAEELGDLLLQVVFQAQIAREQNRFDFDDVIGHICAKLIRRHPHVFGEASVAGTAEVLKNWEAIKAREKQAAGGPAGRAPASLADGVPRAAPALHRAHHLQKKWARAGFDWTRAHDIVAKIEEELGEVKQALASGRPADIREELGDLLFAMVNLSRFQGLNAEDVLRGAIDKFAARVRAVEQRVLASGGELSACTPQELDAHWEAVKQAPES